MARGAETPALKDDGRLSYSVESASEATGIPKSTLWLYIKEGKIETVKIGRRRIILKETLRDFVTKGCDGLMQRGGNAA